MIEQENVALRMRIAAKEATIKDKDRHVDEVRRALSVSFLPHVWSVYDAERAPLNRPLSVFSVFPSAAASLSSIKA